MSEFIKEFLFDLGERGVPEEFGLVGLSSAGGLGRVSELTTVVLLLLLGERGVPEELGLVGLSMGLERVSELAVELVFLFPLGERVPEEGLVGLSSVEEIGLLGLSNTG